jgi:single-strand DNA-binding protein
MSNGNTVVLIGNVTRDPELSYTPSGIAKAAFGLAVNRRWQNRQTQDWEENVSFFDVICWRELAENASESLPKGTRVIVTGRLDQRSWETPDGEHRYKVEITADELGPSLRWATTQVVKNDRREPEPGRERGQADGSYQRRSPQETQSQRYHYEDEGASAHYDDHEEPF